MSHLQPQPRPCRQVARHQRGSGSMMVLACVAAAGVVAGAVYAVGWGPTEAASSAGAASAHSAVHRTHHGANAPAINSTSTSRWPEKFVSPAAEDHLSAAQALEIAQREEAQPGTLPLVRPGYLPPAASFSADSEFNPESRLLTPEVYRALDDLIRATNEKLNELEKARIELALSWARDRISMGDFEFANEPGPSYPKIYGSIVVSIAEREGTPKRVTIVPGEYAPIDVVIQDAQTLIAHKVSEIKGLFAK